MGPPSTLRVQDTRTLILQIFVYTSLFFTLLALPVVVILNRELARRGIQTAIATER